MPTDASSTACKPTTCTAATFVKPSRSHTKEGVQKCSYTGDAPTLVDVFMPRDDALDTEDIEMDITDYELEEFKRFCFMNKHKHN